MKKSDQEQLLKEILGDTNLEDLRESSLTLGVDALQRRRRRRRQFDLMMAVLLPLLLIGAAAYRHSRPAARVAAQSAPPATAETAKVKIITKEELLALFPNRPIALIGRPGRQQVVFLDTIRSVRP